MLVCAVLVLSSLQLVRKFKKTCPFCLHSHVYINPCPFRVPQVLEVCDPLICCVLACEFRVAINEQSDMTTACKFQYFQKKMPPLTTHFAPLICQSAFVGAQVRDICDALIDCVWHVTFGWLSTNTPIWPQPVSSNICNLWASCHYWFYVFDVQVFFVVPQVCETLIDCVWHVNFGWLSTINPTWRQGVSSNFCKTLPPLTSHLVALSCNSCLSVLSA